MNKNKSSEQGFTLIELLIALTIFAIGLMGIAGMQIVAIHENSSSNTRTVTTALAQGILEELVARSPTSSIFDTSFSDKDWDFAPDSSTTNNWFPLDKANYTAKYSIEIASPVVNVARITVVVNGPRNTSVSLVGYKSLDKGFVL